MTIINTTQAGPDGNESVLLEYRLYTTPYPIRVSPSGAEEGGELDPARAQLVFVASNNGRSPVRLRKLTVEIPTGELAAQLALSLERVESTISLDGWTSSRNGERIEFTTTDPYTEIAPGQGLTFQVSNIPVNHEVGAVELRITEGYEGTSSGSLSIFTGKFPQDFYLDGFSADKYEIGNKDTVVLTWKRSEGVTTTLLYGGNDPEDVTKDERKEIKDVRTTTTFYLIGQVGDVQIMRSVLVTVLNPDMVVNNLIVNGALEAKDSLTVHKTTELRDALTVKGELTAEKKLDAKGAVEIDGTLTAKGVTTVKETFTAEKTATVKDDLYADAHVFVDPDHKLHTANLAGNPRGITIHNTVTQDYGSFNAGPTGFTALGHFKANEGAVVHDDFRVTRGEDEKADRMLWVDSENAQFRVETRVLKSGYKNSGELKVGSGATVDGDSVICSEDTIRIYNKEYGGHLNCTSKFGGDHSGHGREAYWLLDRYSDAYSSLRIKKP